MTRKLSAHETMDLIQTALEHIGIDDQREHIGKAIDALMEIREAGIQEPNRSDRFLHIGPAKVHASFYRRSENRFVILAENPGAAHPWVVAHVRNLSDSEWDSGRHMATYGDAVEAWRKKARY